MCVVTSTLCPERTVAKLSLEEVEHIAELARLGLSDAEKETFRDQLSDILDYADILNRLDTRGVPPTASALPVSTVMRRDELRPSLPTEEAMANAPDAEYDQFRVRAVLE
jgi:aspartyl-tRNA(Asn)/glutamyl-tRNA(Gln) amidotransferase subunit C